MGIPDAYYQDERPLSAIGYPPVIPHTARRPRRHSTVTFSDLPPPMDSYRRPSTIDIKFKRKGSCISGISLGEAQGHIRLSNNDVYTVHDLHANHRGRVLLRIRVSIYSTYVTG
jgi:hypothetical protein